ncbi:MAG: class I SAM-dependent methyltransferase [Nanoarchaeota archaeon]|nr:class I SAM-dependent methyltransferase [Nanoarchaeota archaeon]
MTTKIGNLVQGFYNKTPFPDYDLARFNSKEDLSLAAYSFAKILDRSIPENASVIDVGTGTGQLSAFLSLRRECVWGIDFSDSSLKKAKALQEKLGLDSWNLKKVDILDPEQIDAIGKQFDYVLCLGVLHHTGDAYRAFKNIMKLVKPGGHVAIGLYNSYGRLLLKKRIFLAKTIFKNNNAVKDKYIRMQIGEVEDKERARGWWNDQYLHPHETTHTVGEVIDWFTKNGIQFNHTVPSTSLFSESAIDIGGVWSKVENPPSFPVQLYKQLGWIWSTNREGGYWITFGRKPENSSASR